MQWRRRYVRRMRINLALGAVVLIAACALEFGCQGLPPNVANCSVVPTPPSNTSVVPPAPEPPPQALCGFPLTISSAASGDSASSPVHIMGQASPPDPIYTMRLYVDGQAVLYTPNMNIDQYIWMANGMHTVEAVAEDVAGFIATAQIQVNVTSQTTGMSDIQNLPGWLSCSAVIVTTTCAAGLGVAVSSLSQGQSSPAIDGSSAEFTLAGPTGYSNELYWQPFGGGNNVSHFTYDLWFYLSDGNAPQALEFDVNQAFGNTRWTWGTECNFNGTGKWDLWDDSNGVWRASSVPCKDFPSQTWIHLVWSFERVGNQVHYISVNVDDTNYDVDTYYTAQPNWFQEEIDIAFQMDGNFEQKPYQVWLDKVNLDAN